MSALVSQTLELRDHLRPPVPSYVRGRVEVLLERPLVRSLYELSTHEGVSLFVVTLAAFKAVLLRYTGQEQIVIGSAIPRGLGQSGQAFSVGPAVIHTNLGGDPSCRELIHRAATAMQDALANAGSPDLSHGPPFHIMCLALGEPVWTSAAVIVGSELDALEECLTGSDLVLTVSKRDDTLQLSCEYDLELLEAVTVSQLLSHLLRVLVRMVADPSQRVSQLPLDVLVRRTATVEPGNAPEPGELRSYLEARLPPHMVPSAFVVLERLPLSPNGKLDRRALPTPSAHRSSTGYRPPRTPTEMLLAGIWAEVLHVERVGVEDNFFELGGHSLLATQVISRVRSVFGADLDPSMAFEAPTLAEFAVVVDQGVGKMTSRLVSRLDQVAYAEAEAMLSAVERQLPASGEDA